MWTRPRTRQSWAQQAMCRGLDIGNGLQKKSTTAGADGQGVAVVVYLPHKRKGNILNQRFCLRSFFFFLVVIPARR